MKHSKKQSKKTLNYQQLSQYEMDRIEALLAVGHKQKDIALVLKRNPSTISREIKRNRRRSRTKQGVVLGGYDADVAGVKKRIAVGTPSTKVRKLKTAMICDSILLPI